MVPESSEDASFVCRTARLDEVDIFLELWQDLGWEAHPSYPAALYRALSQDGFRVICQSRENQPLGCLLACDYNGVGFIGYFSILPEYRGKGLGAILLQDSIRYLRDKGCISIGLDAVPTAARLYEKHGFISSGKKISWYTLYLDRTSQDTHPHNMMQYSDAVTEVKITDVKALEHLIALDGLITGFKRSQVYKTLIQTPDWRFWTVAGSSDNYGPLEQKHSYIGARPIPGGYGIGPIYAQSLEHAILLVRHAVASLTTISQTPADKLHFAVEACSYNGQIVELFQACGWTEDDYHYHRMWLGPEPEAQQAQSDLIYAVLDSGLG